MIEIEHATLCIVLSLGLVTALVCLVVNTVVNVIQFTLSWACPRPIHRDRTLS
jgi:hypothetical protein